MQWQNPLLFCCFRLIEAIKKLRPQQPELQQEGVPSETPLQQPMRQNQHERVRLQSWNTVLRLSSRQAGLHRARPGYLQSMPLQ